MPKQKEFTVYYAHSKRIYNTKRESTELKFLQKLFPKVIDPNSDMGELGSVEPYLKKIRQCSLVIISEYMNHIGRGAYEEVNRALSSKIPVLVLRDFALFRVMDIVISNPNDWQVFYGSILTKGIRQT